MVDLALSVDQNFLWNSIDATTEVDRYIKNVKNKGPLMSLAYSMHHFLNVC